MRYLFLLAFFCAPAFACVHSLQSTDTFVEVCASSDSCRLILYDDLGFGNNHTKRAEFILQEMQDFLDTRLELITFDPADPDKALDPNCGNLFWGDNTGEKKISLEATHLVSRDCVVDSVVWDGVAYIMSIRRADRTCP
jgi:hypothetical protein